MSEKQVEASGRSEESWALMVTVLTGFTLLFFLSFFNRFAGLRSGDGEYSGGMALLHGYLPYRDYFTAGPPLNTLKSAILLKLFGQTLIVSRVAGVVERLVMGLVLLRWLTRLFRPWHALVATVVTVIVSAGDLTDPIASYNHDAMFFATAAGLVASFALESRQFPRLAMLAIFSGILASLSLLTKQTVGLGAVVCTAFVTAFLLKKSTAWKDGLIWLLGFTTGCAVPLAAVGLWLWRMGVLQSCLRMLFVTGPSAKASHPGDFIIRSIGIAFVDWHWVAIALMALVLCHRAIGRGLKARLVAATTRRERLSWIVPGAALIAIAEVLVFTQIPALHLVNKVAVYYTLIGLSVWLCGQLVPLSYPRIAPRDAQTVLFAAVSLSIAVMLSLSFPAFAAMVFPGFAFLLAAALDGFRCRSRFVLSLMIAILVFLQVREKLDIPFGFNTLNEASVRYATATSVQPQLRGLLLPPETIRLLDETAAVVASQHRSDTKIFTYPEMGLFYALTDRQPPTFATSHNIDFVYDDLAREDAVRLLQSRPAVIVYYQLPASAWRYDEAVWRYGKRSGQRDIESAVRQLIATYRKVGAYQVAPGEPPVEVYEKP